MHVICYIKSGSVDTIFESRTHLTQYLFFGQPSFT
jgi:hypothetical protein